MLKRIWNRFTNVLKIWWEDMKDAWKTTLIMSIMVTIIYVTTGIDLNKIYGWIFGIIAVVALLLTLIVGVRYYKEILRQNKK